MNDETQQGLPVFGALEQGCHGLPRLGTRRPVGLDAEVALAVGFETEQPGSRRLLVQGVGHHVEDAVEAEGSQVHQAVEARRGPRVSASTLDLQKGCFARG